MRYVSRPRSLLVDDPEIGIAATAGEILTAEGDFIETGLLDAQGQRLYRQRERIRLGFKED